MGKDSKCELQIEEIKIKEELNFKYMSSVLTKYGKCETKLRTRHVIAKSGLHKVMTVLRNEKS